MRGFVLFVLIVAAIVALVLGLIQALTRDAAPSTTDAASALRASLEVQKQAEELQAL